VTPTARPARQRLAPEVRRRQVLDAAVAVFSEQGFHGASMDDVAARAGLSKPMVYAHGGSKDELFAACLQREAERLLRSVEAAASGAATEDTSNDPQTRLWLGLRAFFHALTTRRAGWTVLYRQASTGEFAGEVDALRGRIVAQVAALMADGLGMSQEAVRPYAHTLVGAAEGLADWWLTGPAPVTGDDAADVLAGMLMSAAWPGLDALRSGRVWSPPQDPRGRTGPERAIGPYPPVSTDD
jgi:AcrR family transcriptional regulator